MEFYQWTGDVPEGMRYENPMVFDGDEPRVLRAEFVKEAPVVGNIRYVATDGKDSNTGLTLTDAKRTIASAVGSLIRRDHAD